MKTSAKRSQRTRRSRPPPRILVSCEHGGNEVPPQYARLFARAAAVLESHRGLDYGALEVAQAFGRKLGVEPVTAATTRLLVDLNRSPGHRNVFSEFSRELPAAERDAVMQKYYAPYREKIERFVDRAERSGRFVLHISAHSFTPVLNGETRRADLGLLYDPRRRGERSFATAWLGELKARAPQLVVRRNYPYRGTSDALVTHLRRRHGERSYAGIELEVNQKFAGATRWSALIATLSDALAAAVATR
jgi:predicted N-formylglutamate amidohydrolase